jgi:uncharacterized membrane protein
VPAVTAWVGARHQSSGPAATYGAIGFLAGIAYYLLTRTLRNVNQDTRINELLQRDPKAKISLALYALGMAFAFIAEPLGPLFAYGACALVSTMRFIPVRR